MSDIYLAATVGGLAVAILNPHAFDTLGRAQLFGLVVPFAWVFIESLLLSTTGTTPGKWLFKIRLIAPSGQKPNCSAALSRSFKVWWRGCAMYLPLATFLTQLIAYGNLMKNGITTWDKDEGFSVSHERIGPVRLSVAVAFVTMCAAFIIIGGIPALLVTIGTAIETLINR
jgi:hypothetical protein